VKKTPTARDIIRAARAGLFPFITSGTLSPRHTLGNMFFRTLGHFAVVVRSVWWVAKEAALGVIQILLMVTFPLTYPVMILITWQAIKQKEVPPEPEPEEDSDA
jgi:hypothetical protein